jgi:glycosyltransferase involved in cell wall biosynthesis
MLPNYIHFHPVSMKRGMNTDALFAVPKMIKIFRREKFDMIQYSTPNAGAYASVAGKIAKVPVRVYCMWGLVYVSMKGVRRRIFKSVERSVCARSTHIRPDSFGNLAFGEKEGLFPAGKAQVVYNGSSCGIDTDLFDIGQKQRWRKEIRSRFGIEETDKVFGFIGRITGDKGINELLEAFRGICGKMSDAKLLMVGNVELRDTLKPELLEWAQKHPQVIFTGHQPNSQELYAAMDVLVLPSYREGLCNVLIEAQVMGVAVITTEIPGTVEAINPEVTGLTVPAKDSRALSNAMERLYRDDDLRCRMGQKGPEFAVARYNRKLLMEHILDDRRKMLGEME